ncbi:MAG: hypothetical protein AAGK97_11330 [Bacteroidota bacterium]
MKLLTLALSLCLSYSLFSQNVGIGTATPDPSAALEISDSNKGLLIPRTDTANVNNPATGLLIYQLSDNGLYQFNGSRWLMIGKIPSMIEDGDKDTKVMVEQNADDDMIRFISNGNEVLRQNKSTLEMPNSGKSVFIGEEAGINDDLTDNNNVFVGFRAGKENQSGINNVAVGEQALQNGTAGNNNVAIGKQAMAANTGNNNVGIGFNAAENNTSGEKNTAVGGFAGFANQTGNRNTLIGYEAGRGTSAEVNDNVMIGHQAGKNETGSHKLYIANTDTNTPLIHGDFQTQRLTINDSLQVSDHLQVGNGPSTQTEVAEINGAIQIGNAVSETPALNDAGTMRWNAANNDYEGWDGNNWRSMTMVNEAIDCQIGTEIDTLPFIITTSGYYYLNKNLTMTTSGHGIIIATEGSIIIDLNGFTMDGAESVVSSQSGILISRSFVTVKNGTLSNWGSAGIELTNGGRYCSFYNLYFLSNGTGLYSDSFNALLVSCFP